MLACPKAEWVRFAPITANNHTVIIKRSLIAAILHEIWSRNSGHGPEKAAPDTLRISFANLFAMLHCWRHRATQFACLRLACAQDSSLSNTCFVESDTQWI